jgi:transposase
MINYREIIKLGSEHHTPREIEFITGHSHHTVKEILERAARNCPDLLPDDVTDENLEKMLYPERVNTTPYVEPDYSYIHSELAKPGVTLTLLWTEYCEKCRQSGQTPYMSTQFGDKYRKWARFTKATMRITHKPGDAMQVDWAGNTIPVRDSVTGEISSMYLLVAVLPCSCCAYAEACTDMKSENWLLGHVHAYEYFGGVTRLLIPDNLKTGITANTRYETIINRSYQEMAEHYDTAIVPARVKRPQDKGSAEGTVKYISTWIIAALRDRVFFTPEEVQAAVVEKLEEFNSTIYIDTGLF